MHVNGAAPTSLSLDSSENIRRSDLGSRPKIDPGFEAVYFSLGRLNFVGRSAIGGVGQTFELLKQRTGFGIRRFHWLRTISKTRQDRPQKTITNPKQRIFSTR
jgi:hypothetical protein